MTAPLPGLAALAAECDDVRLVADDLTSWCYAAHPEYGHVCLAGRTDEIALARVADYFRDEKRRRAAADAVGILAAADATACTDEEAA